MTRLILILSLIVLVSATTSAQTDSTVFLESNTPLILRLTGNGQPAEASFEGVSGQMVTVVAQATDPATLDLVMEWVAPSGERLAYNDDWAGERTNLTPPAGFETLAASDSALLYLILPEAGIYTARVNTFNGEGVGEFSLTVSIAPERALIIGESQDITLHPAEIATFTLELSAGQRVMLTAHNPRGRLDGILELLNPAGDIVAANDDHNSTDVSLSTFDPRLTFTTDSDGVYTVRLREFLGRQGEWVISAADAP